MEARGLQETIRIYRENYEKLPSRFAEKIEHDLRIILDAGFPNLRKIYLFGSCARGEVRSSSDIDLLVITAFPLTDRRRAADVRWQLDEPVRGVRTDVVYQNESLAQPTSVFEKTVNRDKKLILEVIT